jgi:hypothetical protein
VIGGFGFRLKAGLRTNHYRIGFESGGGSSRENLPGLTSAQRRCHLQPVRFSPGKLRTGIILGLAMSVARLLGAGDDGAQIKPIHVVRAKDQVVIHAGRNLLSFTETIVLEPVDEKGERDRPGTTHIVELIIYPLWIKEGEFLRPAFPVLRPRPSLSAGRVRRFALVKPDGETVNSIAAATPDCAYVLTLDFGHVNPKRFTVTIDLATSGIERETELTYMASNDGHALRSGPPESTYTDLRVFTDGALQSSSVSQGAQVLPQSNSSVKLERGTNHIIRFGQNAP